MASGYRYVIARTAKRRPTLQHLVGTFERGTERTFCGHDISEWSRAYQSRAIPEILCMKCFRVKVSQS